jgi:FkbM family methyltransferase
VAYVEELIRLNGWSNCKLVPAGISEKTEVLQLNFFSTANEDPSASIIPAFRNEKVHHQKNVVVMNESYLGGFLPQVEYCLAKIDVEGAELEVLRGISNWLRRWRPIIIIEILPVYNEGNEFRLQRQQQIEALMEELQYGILRIGKQQHAFKELVQLDTIGIHGDIELCDYVLCPLEMKQTVMDQANTR